MVKSIQDNFSICKQSLFLLAKLSSIIFLITIGVVKAFSATPTQTPTPVAKSIEAGGDSLSASLKAAMDKTSENENLGYDVPPPSVLNMEASQGGGVNVADQVTPTEPLPKIEMIVDSSGSMGQPLGAAKTKMFFLKKMLLRFFMDQWKEKAVMGLRVYGSLSKHQCEDNYLSVAFGEKSIDKIESSVLRLFPLGMTPLFKSVQLATKDLASYKGPKKIIVFTDGEDTCGGDPCKVGKELAAQPNIDVKIYVVAIGFKPEDANFKKVSCLGETQTANSEEDLFQALGGIVSNSISKGRLNLLVKSPDPTAAVHLLAKQPDGTFKFFRSFSAAWGATVPPGVYQAVVQLNPPYKFDTFTIPPGKVVTLTVGGEGKVIVNFIDSILNVEVMDKNRKVIKKFKSDQLTDVPIGRWGLHIYQEPFYDQFVPKFDVYPNGHHEYTVVGAGAVKVKTPMLQGLYVYDSKKNLLGHFVTQVPMALPSLEYIVHVDENCSNEGVTVIDRQIKTVECKPKK